MLVAPRKYGVDCETCEKYIFDNDGKILRTRMANEKVNCSGCEFEKYRGLKLKPKTSFYLDLFSQCANGNGSIAFMPYGSSINEQPLDVVLAFEIIKGALCNGNHKKN